MKKYIIIMLSLLSLFFINVGIVSAEGKASSKLTATEIENVKNRVKEAGLPFVLRDEIKHKGWTDYVIFMDNYQLNGRKKVFLVLYTVTSDDIDSWQIENTYLTRDITGRISYTLIYENNKWYWSRLSSADPNPHVDMNKISLSGYIFYSSRPITETIDNEFIFFSNEVTSAEVAFGVPVEDYESDQDGGILGMLGNIVKRIIAIPGKIIELISNFFKEIFMPDKKVLNNMINDTKAHIESKFSFLGKESEVKRIFESKKSIEDVEVYYGNEIIDCLTCGAGTNTPYLNARNLKIIDSEILNEGLDRFRPIIRGFLVLMLLFYNFNQFLGFIGQKSTTTPGKQEA